MSRSLHRRTSAANTKIAVGASFTAHHAAGNPVTPQSVIDWIKSLHDNAPSRTPNFTCRNRACHDDQCCKRELTHSSVGTYLRLLKNSPVGFPHRDAISSLYVRQHLSALKRSQAAAGRTHQFTRGHHFRGPGSSDLSRRALAPRPEPTAPARRAPHISRQPRHHLA